VRFVVLVCTIAVFFVFIALLNGLGRKGDAMRRRFAQVKDNERTYGDDELKKSFSERVFRPAARHFSERIKRLAGRSKAPGPEKRIRSSKSSSKAPEST
jgi:hypothetical protein